MAQPPQKTKKKIVKQKRVVAKPETPFAPLPADSELNAHWHAAFPIVGIGCSAGGVEALEEFFRHLPSDPGAAFIVITHQHAGHTSLLPELLRRWSPLSIIEARDGLGVEPNNIYVPPSGCRLAILHAVLHLMDAGDGVRPLLPIDYLFCSLSEDQQSQAVGIILSGTGTDGSIGLKAIRAESGLTMVQEPRSAKFAGMPQNAISLGVVDIVASSVELGTQLCDFFRHRTVIHPDNIFKGDGKRDLQKILVYLRDRIGNDFSLYKYNTTLRRIERRMNLNQIASLGSYAQYLQSDASEAQALYRDLLIGVTSFFRDGSTFDVLLHQGLPLLLDDKAEGYTVRAWVPACSTGEEAYSLAMLLQEYRIQRGRRFTIQIFATDIDAEAIDKARHGVYPEGIANQVSPERLRQFFQREDSHYRVRSELRECITFATHNLLKDAPFTKLDLLSCRNFLIYVRAETQQGLLPMFHYSLNPKGLLMLGMAETVEGFTSLFTPLDKKTRIFVREAGPASLPARDLRVVPSGDRAPQDSLPAQHRLPVLVESIQRLLLDQFSPPTVFINRQGHVVYIHGRTGDYLEPAPGSANQQLIDMARPGLRRDLIEVIQHAEKVGKPVLRKNLQVRVQGSLLRVNLAVTPLSQPGPMDGLLMIVFNTVSIRTEKPSIAAPIGGGQVRKGQRGMALELEYTQQRLHRTNTELQISNEEFKSSNEELQSTNEELQSTNEELETTREELQSLNEELITVNTQLQTKFDEAAGVNDDLKNLVNTTEVATIFLDSTLRIKWFTPEASRLTKLIATDVGRPFGDIVSNVDYPNLLADAQTVLQTLVIKEREVKATDGRWYFLRIVPYRNKKNLIDGVVLIYIDITTFKRAAEQMKQSQDRAESIVDQIPAPLIILDTDLRIVTANQLFHKAFSSNPSQILRHPFDRIVGGRFDHPTVQSTLVRLISDKTGPDSMELKLEQNGTWRAKVSRIQLAEGEAPLILLMLHDESEDPLPLTQE